MEGVFERFSADLLASGRRLFASPGDEIFLEFIRVQPFATGGYMRGMLVCGFCTLFFHIYTLALWPDLSVAPYVPTSGSFAALTSARRSAISEVLCNWNGLTHYAVRAP